MMGGFAAFLGRQQKAILFLMASLALAGAVGALSLPVGLFPRTSFPRVRINIDSGARPAHEMMLQVTQPVEQALRAIPGVRGVRSTTSRGSMQAFIDFDWGTNMRAATLEVDAALAQQLPDLPKGTRYVVRRMDPTVFPIIAYALISHSISEAELRTIARYHIVPVLERIPGVAKIGVQGGDTPEVHVIVDPAKLAAMHVTLAGVERAVSRSNVLASVGRLADHDSLYLVVQQNTLRTMAQVRRIVVGGGPDGVVRLGQVARVEMGRVPRYDRVSENDHRAVTLQVFQQPSGNAVQVDAAVRRALAAYETRLPAGVRLVKWYDQSTLVTAAAGSVRDAIAIGVVLAGLVLIGFLRSWRVTLIALLVLPASMATAVLILTLLGMSFNIMTLGGLAAAVGLVIDDAIVMIEHVARRAGRAGGIAARGAVLAAAEEFLAPLAGSSLATLIVFVPLAFLSGVTGAFFKALSITMASTLVASWLFSAFAVPVLARWLIDFDKWHDPVAGGGARESVLARAHGRLLDLVVARPAWLLVALIPFVLAGAYAYAVVPTGFMPRMDEGGFVINYQARPGTSLAEGAREIRQVGDILRADPAVATWSTRLGAGLGGDLNEPYQGDIFVQLRPLGQRAPIWTVMDRIRRRIIDRVPGIDFDESQLMSDLLGDLVSQPEPIEIELHGDPARLDETAKRVAAAIGRIPGVVGVQDGVVIAGDSIDIHVDPAKAAMFGFDPAAVERMVATALRGSVVTALPGQERFTGVRLELPRDAFAQTGDLLRLPLAAPSGALVPLGAIATLRTVSGRPEIDRDNLRQIVAVTGRISGGGISAAIASVRRVLARPGLLPPGMSYRLGGLYRQQQKAFIGLARVFVAAVLAEFVLLLFLYRSFVIAGAIVATALLSSLAVFIGLDLSGVALNITALMGMTMIVGLATEMAIFYISEFRSLAGYQDRREALVVASRNRLRPIAMTTLAAILTLLPLALGIGQGSGMQQPLAIAVISGFVVAFPLVLFGLPALLRLVLRGPEP